MYSYSLVYTQEELEHNTYDTILITQYLLILISCAIAIALISVNLISPLGEVDCFDNFHTIISSNNDEEILGYLGEKFPRFYIHIHKFN